MARRRHRRCRPWLPASLLAPASGRAAGSPAALSGGHAAGPGFSAPAVIAADGTHVWVANSGCGPSPNSYDAEGLVRDGAWVAEVTGMLDLSSWPEGMIARKERPHAGAQLRLTDLDGHRITCFATSTKGGQLASLELRHRRRARCEDRILLQG
jgi:hypothetical protein